jgi:hypothetical protein
VDIVATALADLRGVARLAVATPIARFVAVGIVWTVAYALLLLALMMPLSSEAANAVALAITAVANTAANRRVTSGVRGRKGMLTAIPAEAAASSRAGPRSGAAAGRPAVRAPVAARSPAHPSAEALVARTRQAARSPAGSKPTTRVRRWAARLSTTSLSPGSRDPPNAWAARTGRRARTWLPPETLLEIS